MFIYVASPYSGNELANYEATVKFVADSMQEGYIIFSPIVHCHQIAVDYNLPGDFKFWQRYSYEMLAAAGRLWVLQLPGWEESKGVQAEILYANRAHIPIDYIPYTAPAN